MKKFHTCKQTLHAEKETRWLWFAGSESLINHRKNFAHNMNESVLGGRHMEHQGICGELSGPGQCSQEHRDLNDSVLCM